ncbi:MAG: acyloxyacyl hydrolase [Nitrospirae bacterium]|nr:MAG: acyloxyacyl hydrolase [Nitrospirota bacterium]
MGMSWHGPFGKVLMLLLCLTVWSPTSLAVSASSEDARDVVKRGTMEVGVATGFWQATTVVGSGPSANRSAVFVLPRAGMVMTDALGSGWWEGNVELLVEPLFARFTKPYAAEVAGGSLVVKYNLLSFGRWMPFWDAGAGMVWSNLAPRIPEESTQFQFVLETGPGVHYFMTKTMTMTMGVRFHHFSNAGIGDRNTGLNAFLPYIGVSVFLPE